MIETKVPISGVAVRPGVSKNGINYTSEELIPFASTLIDRPLLKDHESRTDNVIGLVTHAFADSEGVVHYEGWVKEDGTGLLEKIKDKRIKEVSIGAFLEKLVKESDDDEFYTAIGMKAMELSTTPTPGVEGTSLKKALASENVHKYPITENVSDIKKIVKKPVLEEDVTMAEEEQKPVEEPVKEPEAEPVKEPEAEPEAEPAKETVQKQSIELEVDSSKIDEAIKKAEKLIELRHKLKEDAEVEPEAEPAEEPEAEPVEEPVKEPEAEPVDEEKEEVSEEKMGFKGKVAKEDIAEAKEAAAGTYILEQSEIGNGYSLSKHPNADGHYKNE